MAIVDAIASVLRRFPSVASVLDPAIYAPYLSSLLDDDATPNSVLPILQSALSSIEDASAVADAVVAAYVDCLLQVDNCDLQDPAVRGSDSPCKGDVTAELALPHAEDVHAHISPFTVKKTGGSGSEVPLATIQSATAASSLKIPTQERRASRRDRRAMVALKPPEPAISKQPPCRFFVAGDCRRSDCAFSHDVSDVPCRYWMPPGGGCRAGIDCPFLHVDGDAPANASDIEAEDVMALMEQTLLIQRQTLGSSAGLSDDTDAQASDDSADMDWAICRMLELEDLREWHGATGSDDQSSVSSYASDESGDALDLRDSAHFPALYGTKDTVDYERRSATQLWCGGETVATRLALAMLADAFPSLPDEERRRAFDETGRDVRAARAALQQRFDVNPLERAFRTTRTRRLTPGSRHMGTGVPHVRAHVAAARRIAASLAWVSTGDTVAALYDSARRDASALAKARNLAFHRSTQAYLARDGATAARYARDGRALDIKMRAAHATAAARIFAERNIGGMASSPSPEQPSGGNAGALTLPPPTLIDVLGSGVPSPAAVHVLDLHGLHPGEAVAAVLFAANALLRCEQSRGRQDLWLAAVTGTRHHSLRRGKGGGSVRTAVLAALSDAYFEAYDPPSEAGGESGVIVVRVAE